MKLDAPRRKIADDALDLYTPVCTVSSADSQIMQLPIGRIKPYHNHPFHEYTGDRLNDMVESISKHGILVPVIVQPLDSGFYEMLAGHNRMNAASLAGLDTVPAIVKEGLTADEAYYYVIETNVLQRSFSELMPSEQAAVLSVHYSTMISQGKRSDIDRELQLLSGNSQEEDGATQPTRKNSRNALAEQYSLSSARVARLLRLNSLIPEFRERVDNGKLQFIAGVEISYLSDQEQQWLLSFLGGYKVTLNKSSAAMLHKVSKEEKLTEERIRALMLNWDRERSKSKQFKSIKLSKLSYKKYLASVPTEDVADVVDKALELYFNQEGNS